VLEPHLEDERWKEVVPLAAVLAGRGAQPLIQRLTDLAKHAPVDFVNFTPALSLAQCLADEVQVPPELAREALEWIARKVPAVFAWATLLGSRYGTMLSEVVWDRYRRFDTELFQLGSVLSEIALNELNWTSESSTPEVIEKASSLLLDPDPMRNVVGALVVMRIAFSCRRPSVRSVLRDMSRLQSCADQLARMVLADQPYVHFAAAWTLAWLGQISAWSPERNPAVLPRLLNLWRTSPLVDVQRASAWASSSLPLVDRDSRPFGETDNGLMEFLRNRWAVTDPYYSSTAALIVGYYNGAPWTDQELADMAKGKQGFLRASNLLQALAKAGVVPKKHPTKGETSESRQRGSPAARSRKKARGSRVGR
jgi:hypothetical protein